MNEHLIFNIDQGTIITGRVGDGTRKSWVVTAIRIGTTGDAEMFVAETTPTTFLRQWVNKRYFNDLRDLEVHRS